MRYVSAERSIAAAGAAFACAEDDGRTLAASAARAGYGAVRRRFWRILMIAGLVLV